MPTAERPVLLIPGFLAPDRCMAPMARWLRRGGFYAYVAHTGLNVHCSELTMTRLSARLKEISERHDERVVVIGHSRGGQLARALATRHPERVAAAVTLGTPVPLDIQLTHPIIQFSARALGVVAATGIPGIMADSCFHGACCALFREDLGSGLDPSVDLSCIIGSRDALVDRAACVDPAATHVVYVPASHIGTIANPDSYRAIASVLERAWSADGTALREPVTAEAV